MSDVQDIVLSNDLLKLFYSVQQSCLRSGESTEAIDFNKAKQLFAYYKPHLTNIKQLEEILGDEGVSDELKARLMDGEIPPNATLEELAELTRFKIILDEQREDFPYVKIGGKDFIGLHYSGFFNKDKDKTKCIKHLKSLCKTAKSITIYDRYLLENKTSLEWQKLLDNIISLMDCSKKTTLNIVYFNISLCDGSKDKDALDKYLKKIKEQNTDFFYWLTDCKISEYKNCHDRYMKILSDVGSVEVLLSSGFDHLFDNQKDLTYVVRPV